jgi:predicted nucleotidyltransferase
MIAAFRDRAVQVLSTDPRFRAVLAAGSVTEGREDRFSDLDLVLVVEDDAYAQVSADKIAVAAELGDVLTAFTGEHVGEPRLLICLYAVNEGDGVLHVDLKFVRAADLAERVDDPIVLWERDEHSAEVLKANAAVWPVRPAQWYEDRIWVWLHYGAARLARGERHEALATIAWLREQVLGPLLARRAGVRQRGLRYIETVAGAEAILKPTAVGLNSAELWSGLKAVMASYRTLRSDELPAQLRSEAERRVTEYMDRWSKAHG